MKILSIALSSLAAACALAAHAEGFVGVAGGSAQWPNAACPPTAASCDRRDGTWLARAGFMFLPYIGIEARYVDLGRSSFSVTGTANGASVDTDSRFKSRGAGVGAVFAAPVWDNTAITAVAGAARMKTSLDTPDVTIISGEGAVTQAGFRADETKTNAYYGVGVDYRFAPDVSVGVEATRYRIDLFGTGNVDAFTASLTYHFR